jgi:class 3 adenylate cyclase/tetratricopeptide (TPR) repeat protein
VIACPKCRSSNPDGARFCNQCGAPLAPAVAGDAAPHPAYTPKHLVDRVLGNRAALQGERKRVTVLFADIKGSTKLAEQAGAEAWHGILDRFFSILTGCVHRFEGTVNQYTGDGIMALFGAPVAHEDHAQRACFSALAMQADVRRFADELRLKRGLNLSMRIGLNTGEVIVGSIGDDLRMDYTAQGLTVNLAARMEHICEPGHVYLTRDTAQQVEGYFRLRDLGEMEVAGAPQPLQVYDLEGEGPIRSRLDRQMARLGSQFVGREPEMAALLAALQQARDGTGQVVAVIGNAGIGKSRLCREFAESVARAGIPVHQASGVPYASALPLLPVQHLLRSRLGLPEGGSPADIRRLVAGTFLLQDPANAALLPAILDFLGVPDPAVRAPEQVAEQRPRVLELLARWLPQSDGPAQLLLIEDLHFADPATEEFLERLCREIAGTRTLLLLNYRPEYISERLIPHLVEQIQVTALSDAQIADLVRSVLGGDASLAGVAEHIAQRAQGNPFYAEEAILSLVESGHLAGDRGGYVLVRPVEAWRIPDTVHALIASRIDRLAPEHKTLLQSASVIGQDFRPRWLASLPGFSGETLESGLAVLEDSGFVHQRDETPEPQYRFCHPLVREVAYQTQLEAQRMQAHAQLAEALEAAHPLTEALPSEMSVQIAHHWSCAGVWEKAGAWSLQAARWYVTRDISGTPRMFREAIACFDRAADSPEVLKGRIAARAGLLRMAQFVEIPREELESLFREARHTAESSGDAAGLAELMLSYANEYLHRGEAEAAVRLATEAVQQAMAVGAGSQIAHRFRLALLLIFNSAGYPREGLELVNQAAGTEWMTEPIGAENFMSRGFYGLMLGALGRLPEAYENVRQAVAYADREDRAASWMHANLVDLAWMSGDTAPAMAEGRKAVERAESFGSPFFRVVAMRALALAHCLQGSAGSVIPLMEELLPYVRAGGLAHQFEANFLAVLSEAYGLERREHEAEAAALAGIDSARRSDSRVWEIRAWIAWFQLPATDARRGQATEGLQRMEALIDGSGAEGFRPWYWLGREHWAASKIAAREARHRAVEAFAKIGAEGHVRRLQVSPDRPGG